MQPDAPPPELSSILVGKYGVPSLLLVIAWWLGPKVWGFISAKLNIAGQQNDLTAAGLGGMNDVVSTLRQQISDLTQQFKDVDQKLKDMSATLDQAVAAKMLAEQAAAQAKNELFVLQLYVTKLQAQIRSMGATPVEQ